MKALTSESDSLFNTNFKRKPIKVQTLGQSHFSVKFYNIRS